MNDPLAAPGDAIVLAQFLEPFRIRLAGDPRVDLESVARAFSRLPYENLTKILRHSEAGRPSFRTPEVVVSDHIRFGAGGTCFSLAAALLYLVRSLGLRAEPILADRRYGRDTHAAILVWLDERVHLLDPGYLITSPVPLAAQPVQSVETPFQQILLTGRDDGKLDLSTSANGKVTHRLTYRTDPADPSAFVRAWRASFDWEMMHYPLLTRVVGDAQVYLQMQRRQIRTKDCVRATTVSMEDLAGGIAEDFGINTSLVRRALAVLVARGDLSDG